jgi:hypothetical protein
MGGLDPPGSCLPVCDLRYPAALTAWRVVRYDLPGSAGGFLGQGDQLGPHPVWSLVDDEVP